jgi:hypothetical protein
MGNIIITKKIRGGVVFARTEENAEDQLMGKDADSLAGWIKKLKKQGVSVSKFEINKKGHVLYRQRGSFHFVYALIKGLEFPD